MPYIIKYVEGDARPWKVIKKESGEVVGTSETREDAEASIRARYAGKRK